MNDIKTDTIENSVRSSINQAKGLPFIIMNTKNK